MKKHFRLNSMSTLILSFNFLITVFAQWFGNIQKSVMQKVEFKQC